jgi:hypothetical protein
MIKVGDLVRIAPRRAVTTQHSTQVGLVFGLVGLESRGWGYGSDVCAKIKWTSGTETVTGLPMLELVQ